MDERLRFVARLLNSEVCREFGNSPDCFCFDLVPKWLQHIDLELIKPAPQCGEAFRIDFVNAFSSFSAFAYQASFSEDLEMVGHSRSADAHALGELAHAHWTRFKPLEDRPARESGKGPKRGFTNQSSPWIPG